MNLGYVLQQVGYKIGKNPAIAGQRNVLLRFANEAAKELYDISDMAGCLSEQLFNVNNDQTIAFPAHMGEPRAMRRVESQEAISLSQMRPRYNQFNWRDGWKNWRMKGLQTLQQSIHNQSLLTIKVGVVESPPVVVTVVGSTATADNVSETFTMTSTTMTTVNSYVNIHSFSKTTVNTQNVYLLDIDGNQLSYIPNNFLKAQFQILDISLSPWYPNVNTINANGQGITQQVNPLFLWVEVLYKKALPWYQNDSDEFPAVGYDNVWVNKCLQLWYEEQGNVPLAQAMMAKANQTLAQIHENANRGTDDCIAFVQNEQDLINPRVGFGRDWRWAYRYEGR
jgi:hypothetical protein